VLILGFAGEGPAPHGLSYVAAGGFATAREILHPAEAGFRMTACFVSIPWHELGNPQVRGGRPRTGVSALLG